jgi:hypothetical protein
MRWVLPAFAVFGPTLIIICAQLMLAAAIVGAVKQVRDKLSPIIWNDEQGRKLWTSIASLRIQTSSTSGGGRSLKASRSSSAGHETVTLL